MVYSQRENNEKIFQLSNEIGNFKHETQTLGMYYARLRSSWEELSHYDNFIEWPTSAPSENVHIPPTAAEIYAKIVKKTRVFQFLAELNPDFEYARVHLLDRTPFPTLEEAHAYCLSDQSCRSPMPPISGIPSETSAMAVRYAYPAPSSVPSQTSHTSSPSLSLLPTASSNSRPPRKKCDYCVRPLPSEDLSSPPSDPLLVYTRRHPGCQPPTSDCQASTVALGLPPATDFPLSGTEPFTASIPITNDYSPVSHSDDDRPIAIRKEKCQGGYGIVFRDDIAEKAFSKGWLNILIVTDSKTAAEAYKNNGIPWQLHARWKPISSKVKIRLEHTWREVSANDCAHKGQAFSLMVKKSGTQ
ncbi:hypothetical protein GIB67_022970 [Kingdonia uniflora]|uniref:Uncharacterized protein n=1 Tax=Kingdonia uniflora TaxID=39325 RepID=A0A7J7P2F1_9MAGN|nr:hypothetical protein GIB67_022970 [Kingdonia uniflora]